MRLPPQLAIVACPVIASFSPLVGGHFAIPSRPVLTTVAALLPVGLVITAIYRRLPKGGWWWRFAVLASLNFGLGAVLFFAAAARLSVGMTAVLYATGPFFAMAVSIPLLREFPVPTQGVCAAVGFSGVAFITLNGAVAVDPLGVALALGAVAVNTTGLVLTKRWEPSQPPILQNGWQLMLTGLGLLPVMLWSEGVPERVTATNVGAYFWLGFIAYGLAYSIWFWAVPQLQPTAQVLIMQLLPVCSLVIGYLVLGEGVGALQLFGVVLVIGSAVVASRCAPSGNGVGPSALGVRPTD